MPTTSLSVLQSIPTRRKGVDDTVQIGTEHLSHAPGPAACMRVGPVVESIGNVGSLSSQGGGSNRVAGHCGEIGLPAQNLTKPPVIPRHPGQTDSIGEIACSQVEVESGNAAARRQGSGQQCWVAEFTRGGDGPFDQAPTVHGRRERVQHRIVGDRPGILRRVSVTRLETAVTKDRAEPGQALP